MGWPMKALLLLGAAAVLLSGCVSAEDRMRQAQAVEDQRDETCQSWGASPGTDQYYECRRTLYQQGQQDEAQKRALVMQYMMNQQQYQYHPAPLMAPVMQPPSPQVHCTTSYVGDQAYTNCF